MKTVRRLYFYAVVFISLEVVLWGVIGLLRSILDAKHVLNGAQALAQALSLILVGVPIFLFHWLWAQRTSAKDEEERTASLRAIFLYGVLLGTLIPVVQNLLALINRTFLSTAHLYVDRAIVGGSQTLLDNVIAIIINLLIAAYFWNILRNEWETLPDQENFAEVRRLYRFIWVLYGLLMVLYGSQQALNFAFTLSNRNILGQIGRETVVNAIALLVVGTPIWFYSWRILQDALQDSAEKESILRLGILYFLALGGVIITLTAGGNLAYTLLNRLFGEQMTWTELFKKIGNPISIGLPLGIVWAYYGHWLKKQIEFESDLLRRASKNRIYFYILSALGLIASFTGISMLLALIIHIITGHLSSDGFRHPLSSSFATLIVGLPVWLMNWAPMQGEAVKDDDLGNHARRSVIRKSYLYLVLFASVIGGMISAVILVFTLINSVLGGDTSNFTDTVLNSLQVLILFIVLLLYHLYALQKDNAARADVLEAKQGDFGVLIFNNKDGKFGDSIKTALTSRAPRIPVTMASTNDSPSKDMKISAVVLPGSLVANMPANLSAWLSSFNGSKFIVPDEAAGVYWMNDAEQTAESVHALAEGQEIRSQSTKKSTSVWTYVAYVFAALFALQVLLFLVVLGISMVTGF